MDLSVYLPQVTLYILGYTLSTLLYPGVIDFTLNKFPRLFAEEEKKGEKLELGKIIGILERGLILTAAYSDNLSLVPMLLTAKSIIRFPEASGQGRRFAEYYLIGTLTSFLLALSTGIIIREALNLI